MALLTAQEFKQRRPQGDYKKYLTFLVNQGGAQMRQQAQQALRGLGGGQGPRPSQGGPPRPGQQPTRPGQPGGPGQPPRPPGAGAPPPAGAGPAAPWGAKMPGSPDAVIDNPEYMQYVLQQAGLDGGTLDELLSDAMLASGFGGVAQWRANLSGEGDRPADSPYLQNVSMDFDRNQLRRIIGEALGYMSRGQTSQLQGVWDQREALVPEWAGQTFSDLVGPDVYGQARDSLTSGLPFRLDMLKDPGINLDDPSKPLFGAGDNPQSMFGVTMGQAGELTAARSAGAEEFLRQYGSIADRYYNRDAGAPVPEGMEGGLGFGAMGGSPLQDTDIYKRWSAYNQVGSPESTQGLLRGEGATYNPFDPGASSMSGYAPTSLGGQMLSGGLRPEYLAGQPSEFPDDLLTSAFGLQGAAAYGRPDLFWQDSPYAPWELPPEVWARLLAMYQDPMQMAEV